MELVRAKLTNMEDRSRRNNLEMRGISESVLHTDLCSYATTIFNANLPALSDLDLTIDRIHHLPEPPHLSELRFHLYHPKEQAQSGYAQ